MKYKRLFNEDGFYNEEGQKFLKEYKDLIVPFIEKHMLLDLDCNDMQCIILGAIALPMATLMLKRMHGLSPFTKKEEETNE